MSSKRMILGCALVVAMFLSVVASAQRDRRSRSYQIDRNGTPSWELDATMPKDIFTFVRIRYSGYGRRGSWRTDYPDAELNFSYRLQQMTSLKVHPEGRVLDLTDPELFEFPFIYMVEVGGLRLEEEEVPILRRYLLNGGFLMVDDFWGEDEYENLHEQLKLVFPGFEPEELDLDHEIFHCVFDLKEKPQIPNIDLGTWSQRTGITWERPDAREVHIKAIRDENERIMVIICHNTDLGDGWEREGENEYYFREFSEKKAYPLGINIVFYAMTH